MICQLFWWQIVLTFSATSCLFQICQWTESGRNSEKQTSHQNQSRNIPVPPPRFQTLHQRRSGLCESTILSQDSDGRSYVAIDPCVEHIRCTDTCICSSLESFSTCIYTVNIKSTSSDSSSRILKLRAAKLRWQRALFWSHQGFFSSFFGLICTWWFSTAFRHI